MVSASRYVIGSKAITTSLIMTVFNGVSSAALGPSKRLSRSRRVMSPMSLPPIRPLSVTGTQLHPTSRMTRSASATVALGPRVVGFKLKAVSCSLTRLTMAACSSMLWCLWMMPMPPANAKATAMRSSVTDGPQAPTIGVGKLMFLENRECSLSASCEETCIGGRNTMSRKEHPWIAAPPKIFSAGQPSAPSPTDIAPSSAGRAPGAGSGR
mmetsp:Transcript_4453/g.13505  ORF Transcript_4453/g.13505 Transcript_4453/m.13505 type:complete len:211 (+) Transcript_4453:1021-1653(+)